MPTPRVTIDALPEQATPEDGNFLVVQDDDTTKKMSIATLKTIPSTALTAHLTDTSDAHDASAISSTDSGQGIDSTTVQGQLGQLASALIGGGVVGPPGPPGADGADGATGPAGPGVATGGTTGQVLTKLSATDYDTNWQTPTGGGGSGISDGDKGDITVSGSGASWQVNTNAITAGELADNAVDTAAIANSAVTNLKLANANAMTLKGNNTGSTAPIVDMTAAQAKTLLALTKSDVGLGNVDNTSDANKPVFSTSSTTPGIVPGSNSVGTGSFLRADGTWALPPGGGGLVGHASYTHNSTLTEPPTTGQLRFNNATQSSATKVWVSQNDEDGLDVSVGLAKVLVGHQIYIQDYDNAANWIKYNITAVSDDGAYYDFTVTYHSGPGGIPAGSGAAGRVEFQPVAPGTVGVPPGGTTGQALTKSSSADYAVTWSTPAGGSSTRTINTYAGTTLTAVTGDAGAYVRCTGTNPTYTLPTNATVSLAVGTQIDGVGTATAMTLVAAGGVTVNKARTLVTVAADSGWTAIKVATDEWDVHGDLV